MLSQKLISSRASAAVAVERLMALERGRFADRAALTERYRQEQQAWFGFALVRLERLTFRP